MDFFKSSNPALSEKIFAKAGAYTSDETMTVQGTMNKTLLMLLLVVLGAAFTWGLFFDSIPADPSLNVSLPTSFLLKAHPLQHLFMLYSKVFFLVASQHSLLFSTPEIS